MPSVPLRTALRCNIRLYGLYLILSYAAAETLPALSLNCTYTVLTSTSASTVATWVNRERGRSTALPLLANLLREQLKARRLQ